MNQLLQDNGAAAADLAPATPHPALARRTLLGGAAVAGAALAFGTTAVLGSSNAFAAATASADFLRLSEFLTGGKPLAAGLARRYEAALAHHDPHFVQGAAALQAYVAGAQATGIDDLLARTDLGDGLRKTITQIVSAWYLGIVGDDKDVELVSYAEALMYRPTIDVLVVPSYGRGPDSWGSKPPVSTTPNAVLAEEKKPS